MKGIVFDSNDNLYIADYNNSRIRKVDKNTNIISTIAGTNTPGFTSDGSQALNSKLANPSGITFDNTGNLYFSDTENSRIRKIDKSNNIISTIAGNGIPGFNGDMKQAIATQLYSPTDIKFDSNENLYFVEPYSNKVRKVDKSTGIVYSVAGNGFSFGDGVLATEAILKNPTSGTFDNLGNLYITDTTHHQIRKVDKYTSIITTVAGNGIVSLYTGAEYSGFSGDNVQATNTQLNYPRNIAFDGLGNLYIADTSNYRVRKVDKTTGIITTVAGNGVSGFSGDGGQATNASIGASGITFDSSNNLYISGSSRVRKIDKITGIITTVVGGGTSGLGDGGIATNAQLKEAINIAFDGLGNLYIADFSNNRVRKVDKTTGIISTILTGYSKLFLDSEDNFYVIDSSTIKKVKLIPNLKF